MVCSLNEQDNGTAGFSKSWYYDVTFCYSMKDCKTLDLSHDIVEKSYDCYYLTLAMIKYITGLYARGIV
jgi:hypothetical protein